MSTVLLMLLSVWVHTDNTGNRCSRKIFDARYVSLQSLKTFAKYSWFCCAAANFQTLASVTFLGATLMRRLNQTWLLLGKSSQQRSVFSNLWMVICFCDSTKQGLQENIGWETRVRVDCAEYHTFLWGLHVASNKEQQCHTNWINLLANRYSLEQCIEINLHDNMTHFLKVHCLEMLRNAHSRCISTL